MPLQGFAVLASCTCSATLKLTCCKRRNPILLSGHNESRFFLFVLSLLSFAVRGGAELMLCRRPEVLAKSKSARLLRGAQTREEVLDCVPMISTRQPLRPGSHQVQSIEVHSPPCPVISLSEQALLSSFQGAPDLRPLSQPLESIVGPGKSHE